MINDPDDGYIYPCKDTLPDLTLVIGGNVARILGALLRRSDLDITSKLFLAAFLVRGLVCRWREACYAAIKPIAGGPENRNVIAKCILIQK